MLEIEYSDQPREMRAVKSKTTCGLADGRGSSQSVEHSPLRSSTHPCLEHRDWLLIEMRRIIHGSMLGGLPCRRGQDAECSRHSPEPVDDDRAVVRFQIFQRRWLCSVGEGVLPPRLSRRYRSWLTPSAMLAIVDGRPLPTTTLAALRFPPSFDRTPRAIEILNH